MDKEVCFTEFLEETNDNNSRFNIHSRCWFMGCKYIQKYKENTTRNTLSQTFGWFYLFTTWIGKEIKQSTIAPNTGKEK